MPSIAVHMAVAKLVADMLNIDDNNFILGNILPDIVSGDDSHHKIRGKYYLIPDLSYFKNKLDFNNKLHLGYYTHLLLDKYFLEDYILNNVNDLNIFKNKEIYKDYDCLNYRVINNYNLDVDKIKNIIIKNKLDNIDDEKLNKNINCLVNINDQESKYLNYDSLINFIDDVSLSISKEVEEF